MKSISELKIGAKQKIREKLGKVLLCTLGYLIFVYVLQILLVNLSGYAAMLNEYSKLILSAGSDPNKVYELLESGAFNRITWPEITPAAWAIMAAVYVMTVLLDAGYEKIGLLVSRGEKISFKNIFDVFNHTGRALIVCFLRGILTGLGFVLFIVPGFVVMYQYRLAVLVMYDDPNAGAIECLRRSRTLMRGHKMELFVLELSFIGWLILDYFVSAMFIPIVQLWLSPYICVTRANYYNELTGWQRDVFSSGTGTEE
jgi:uncharacterized membrane protein